MEVGDFDLTWGAKWGFQVRLTPFQGVRDGKEKPEYDRRSGGFRLFFRIVPTDRTFWGLPTPERRRVGQE